MRIDQKVAHLKEHHFSEWLKTRQEVEDRVSRSFSMFCLCGRLATGLHERSCRRFQAKVDSETAKELSHLLTVFTKSKYMIDYQLEDEEPQHKVVSGTSEDQAEMNLKDVVCQELVDQGLSEQEAEDHTNTLTVLEIKKV